MLTISATEMPIHTQNTDAVHGGERRRAEMLPDPVRVDREEQRHQQVRRDRRHGHPHDEAAERLVHERRGIGERGGDPAIALVDRETRRVARVIAHGVLPRGRGAVVRRDALDDAIRDAHECARDGGIRFGHDDRTTRVAAFDDARIERDLPQ